MIQTENTEPMGTSMTPVDLSLPLSLQVDAQLKAWLQEDVGRGDWTTLGLGAAVGHAQGQAIWVTKAKGVVPGLPLAPRGGGRHPLPTGDNHCHP